MVEDALAHLEPLVRGHLKPEASSGLPTASGR
jgi:hypothetical protein